MRRSVVSSGRRSQGPQPQRQPGSTSAQAQPQPVPQVRQAHGAPAIGAVDGVAGALQPHGQPAPAQSTQGHEGEAVTIMAIS